MTSAFVSPDDIRSAFSTAMSAMYRSEVPLYGELIEIVEAVNARVLASNPHGDNPQHKSDLLRLGAERHGAIRIGTADELSMLRRAFAVMGMYPVGYYDLAVAGVPVHSTAFRPIDSGSLNRNPFRVFTSLLRLELIEDEDLRAAAENILAKRHIFSDAAIALVYRAEAEGGLVPEASEQFVSELLETFRWQSRAFVDAATYDRLNRAHRLIADVVSFKGPHINHLTPRVLDIDDAQAEMASRGIDAKAVIEGPPRRSIPILLRQTSFKALEEPIIFTDMIGETRGTHTARFGEIEQRGIALTPKGRSLYDRLLDQARNDDASGTMSYEARLASAFSGFPDDHVELRRQDLAYYRYAVVDSGALDTDDRLPSDDLEHLIISGHIRATPITYEDFLPVSAAGIFQSNLGGEEQRSYETIVAQAAFEAALGSQVHDPFALYAAEEQMSLDALRLTA